MSDLKATVQTTDKGFSVAGQEQINYGTSARRLDDFVVNEVY